MKMYLCPSVCRSVSGNFATKRIFNFVLFWPPLLETNTQPNKRGRASLISGCKRTGVADVEKGVDSNPVNMYIHRLHKSSHWGVESEKPIHWTLNAKFGNIYRHFGDLSKLATNSSVNCGVSVGPLSGLVISERLTWNHRIDAGGSLITVQTIIACQLRNRTVTLDVISLHGSDKTTLRWPFVFIKIVFEPTIDYDLKLKTLYPFIIV